MSVKWQGMEKLTATISNAQPKTVQLPLQVLKNNGEKGKRIAKQLAPKDTEFLKDHITTSYPGMEAHIHGEAGYDGYQEYGTRYQPGTPHFRPMLEQIQPEFQKDMTNVMKGAFK